MLVDLLRVLYRAVMSRHHDIWLRQRLLDLVLPNAPSLPYDNRAFSRRGDLLHEANNNDNEHLTRHNLTSNIRLCNFVNH